MGIQQKALIVRTSPDGHDGLDDLNIELKRGWRVVEVCPMGGAGAGGTGAGATVQNAALVIIEARDRTEPVATPAAAAKDIEEEAEELIEEVAEEVDEVVEGDGAGTPANPSQIDPDTLIQP